MRAEYPKGVRRGRGGGHLGVDHLPQLLLCQRLLLELEGGLNGCQVGPLHLLGQRVGDLLVRGEGVEVRVHQRGRGGGPLARVDREEGAKQLQSILAVFIRPHALNHSLPSLSIPLLTRELAEGDGGLGHALDQISRSTDLRGEKAGGCGAVRDRVTVERPSRGIKQ